MGHSETWVWHVLRISGQRKQQVCADRNTAACFMDVLSNWSWANSTVCRSWCVVSTGAVHLSHFLHSFRVRITSMSQNCGGHAHPHRHTHTCTHIYTHTHPSQNAKITHSVYVFKFAFYRSKPPKTAPLYLQPHPVLVHCLLGYCKMAKSTHSL